jgi:hypothetical protein
MLGCVRDGETEAITVLEHAVKTWYKHQLTGNLDVMHYMLHGECCRIHALSFPQPQLTNSGQIFDQSTVAPAEAAKPFCSLLIASHESLLASTEPFQRVLLNFQASSYRH